MQVAMSVVCQDRAYHIKFYDEETVQIGSDAHGELGINIPKLKNSFTVNYHLQEIWIRNNKTKKITMCNLNKFFTDYENQLVIFCTEEILPKGVLELPPEFELNFGRCAVTQSGRRNHLLINLPFISREHGRIVRKGKKTFIEDTGSRNGIFVNGEKIQKKTLNFGDEISICTVRIQYSKDGMSFFNTGTALRIINEKKRQAENTDNTNRDAYDVIHHLNQR